VFQVTALTYGVHEFVASYPGNQTFAPASSTKLVLAFEPIATSLAVNATPQNAPVGTAVTVCVIAGAKDGTIPSPITLTSDGQPLGTVYPDKNGEASLVVTTFAAGTHTIVASYAGTMKYSAASATTTLTVSANGFAIALHPATLTLGGGQQGTSQVVLTSQGSFSGPVHLLAGPGPVPVSLGAATVTLSAGGTGTSVLTVSTIAAGQGNAASVRKMQGTGVMMAGLLGLPLWFVRRRGLVWGLCVLVGALGLIGLSGCTEVRAPLATLAPGTYSIPVTATDGAGTSHTAMLTVVVTQ
jgi:hypothetical protein